MNRPAGSIAVWWTSPLDIDAQYTGIPFPREHRDLQATPADSEPFRARIARVMRTDVSELKSSHRRREAELLA
jgi:hypothetical protein